MTLICKLCSATALALVPAMISPAFAQSSATPYSSYQRYDAAGRVTGTIEADPNASNYIAVRNTYDTAGRLTKVEKGYFTTWQSDAVAPANWSNYTVKEQTDFVYDVMDRKVQEKLSSGGTQYKLTQTSYDLVGRVECVAERMNPSAYSSLPTSACTLGTEGAFGPDRITKNVYDAAGQLLKVQRAVGTSLAQDEATYTYSNNGKRTSLTDARGYRAELTYDGFDRQKKWIFPSKTSTGVADTSDYEEYGYDANDNRTGLKKRDGRFICHRFNAHNRPFAKFYTPTGSTLNDCTGTPTGTDSVWYRYDNRGLQTFARYGSTTGSGLSQTYDNVGRLASAAGTLGTFNYQYDANGNRTRITHPDSFYASYDFDGMDRPSTIKENGSTTLITFGYDQIGRRTAITRPNDANTAYSYDGVSRLAQLDHDFVGTTNDVAFNFAYNPASQITSRAVSNDGFGFIAGSASEAFAVNGQNQLTSAAGATIGYDANGNLMGDGTTTFLYDVENRLTGATGAKSATLTYDPSGRMASLATANGTEYYGYDGPNRLIEAASVNGPVSLRYVFGLGEDEVLVKYEGSGTGNRSYHHSDHQGSIIAISDAQGIGLGVPTKVNRYDEYGNPENGNDGAFQYTGQVWMPRLSLYHYKARAYDPKLGRFLQIDPVGYNDQVNLFSYADNDPVTSVDDSGEQRRVVISPPSAARPAAARMAEAAQAKLQRFDPSYREPGSLRAAGSAGSTVGYSAKTYSNAMTARMIVGFRTSFDHAKQTPAAGAIQRVLSGSVMSKPAGGPGTAQEYQFKSPNSQSQIMDSISAMAGQQPMTRNGRDFLTNINLGAGITADVTAYPRTSGGAGVQITYRGGGEIVWRNKISTTEQ